VFFLTLEAGGERTVINGRDGRSPPLFHHGVIIVLLVCHSNLSVSPGTRAAPFVNPEENRAGAGGDFGGPGSLPVSPICIGTGSFISHTKLVTNISLILHRKTKDV